MTLVELRQSKQHDPVSGGAMDRVVEVKRIDRRLLIAGGAALALLLSLLFWFLAPSANSQTVSASRLQISTARNGTFEDFLPVRGRVTPSITVQSMPIQIPEGVTDPTVFAKKFVDGVRRLIDLTGINMTIAEAMETI